MTKDYITECMTKYDEIIIRIYLLAANYRATTTKHVVASVEVKTKQYLSSTWRCWIGYKMFYAGLHPAYWTVGSSPSKISTVWHSLRVNA